jgi:hypothetical protein
LETVTFRVSLISRPELSLIEVIKILGGELGEVVHAVGEGHVVLVPPEEPPPEEWVPPSDVAIL